MRPFGPVPAIAEVDARSPAIFRTSGLAKIRDPSPGRRLVPVGGRCHRPHSLVVDVPSTTFLMGAGLALRCRGRRLCRRRFRRRRRGPRSGSPISPLSPTARTRRPTTPASSAASRQAPSRSRSTRLAGARRRCRQAPTSQLAIAASEAPATLSIRTEAITAAPHPTGGKQGPPGRFLAMFRRTVARMSGQGARDPPRRRRRRAY